MKVVTINSNRDIFVYGTDYTQNKVNEDKPSMNLNTTTWLNTKVLIKQGIFDYPAEIKDWKTVQALRDAKILTISEAHEGEVGDEQLTSAVASKKKAEKLEEQENEQYKKLRARKAKLAELADRAADKQIEEMAKL